MFDALDCMKMAQAYVDEAGEYSGVPYDREWAVAHMIASIESPNYLFIVTTNAEGESVGFLWAVCAPILPWSPALVAMDQIVYVRPEYRGSRHGLKLIARYQEWAEEQGAIETRLSIASGVHEDQTGRLYQKLGFEYLGSHYRRRT